MFKKTRIGKIVVACALIMALVTPMAGFADDLVTERPIVRPDREKVEKFLEVVKKYSPETLSDWKALAEERKALLEDIYEIREDIRDFRKGKVEERKNNIREHVEDIKRNFREEATELRRGLTEKVKNGEITREEAKAQVREFADSHKEMVEAKKAEIKGKIEEWKAEKKAGFEQWKDEHQDEIDRFKSKREEIKALREELKVAVEADDSETVKAVLEELYPEMLQINSFLAKRLELLQEKYDDISTLEDIVISDEL